MGERVIHGNSTMFLVHHWSEMFELVRLPPQPQRTTPCLRPRRSNRSRASCRALRSSGINKAQGSLSNIKNHTKVDSESGDIWRIQSKAHGSEAVYICLTHNIPYHIDIYQILSILIYVTLYTLEFYSLPWCCAWIQADIAAIPPCCVLPGTSIESIHIIQDPSLSNAQSWNWRTVLAVIVAVRGSFRSKALSPK